MLYAELHCHSAFSFLDGASSPDELVDAAVAHGYRALALTDHDNLCGAIEFAQAAKAAGLKAIHGAEVRVVDERSRSGGAPSSGAAATTAEHRHLTLLVKDAQGWSNLCRLLTLAHAHTRDGRERGQPELTLEQVEAHAEGLICLSGCAGHGFHDEPSLRRLLAVFGRNDLRVELQRPFARHDRALGRELAERARLLGVPCVASGNVHAHAASRAPLQDTFVAVRSHLTLDGCEPQRRGNHSHVLASPQAMAARFEDHPEALAESERIAERCQFDLTSDLGYRYPGAEDDGADRDLVEACQASFDHRYPHGHQLRDEAAARLSEELKIIAGLGLSGFFLLHCDMLELAREVAAEVRGPSSARALLPPGRGRGSSVSSIVCYLTGLSHVDPVANRLLLGRFLSEQITELPDIDLDFPRDIREKLIPRIHQRYGVERTALVAAFPTYKARGAIRDFGAALGLPAGEIERVARSSEGWSLRGFDEQIAEAIGEERAQSGRWRWLAALAREASGLPRHLAQHSGGMIVATRPLIDCCPVVPSAIEGRQIAHWDKDSCADAGFLKIDLLGLGMLSAVERCVEQIDARRGERIDLSRIPYDDAQVYEAIQRGETTGVFQIESRAQIASLRRTRPTNLDEITIQVAIVRPGPIQGGAVNPYIKRRQALNANPDFKIPYPHHSLGPILRETLGTIIFQDQVIEVAMAFAGFSAADAAGLRRAMSRKRSAEAIESHRRGFIEGAMARWPDVDETQAAEVFEMVAGFAGFGFPKAHAAAFGLLAYQSTWLRVHYGPELLAALLDEQPMGFYPPDSLVHEAQRRGTTVLAPDLNESALGCLIDEQGALRLGLRHVRGVRKEQLEELIEERSANGPFASLSDLTARAGGARSSLEALAWAGACDRLGDTDAGVDTDAEGQQPRPGLARRAVLWQLGIGAPAPASKAQLSLGFDLPAAPALDPLTAWQTMLADYAATGLTTGSHPLELMRPDLDRRGALPSAALEQAPQRSRVSVGGLVVARQRPSTASGVCFVLLEDEQGTINLVLKPQVYERFRLTVRTEPLVFAEGILERHASAGGTVNLLVDRIEALEPGEAQLAEIGELICGDFRAVAPAVMSFAQGRRR